MKVFKKADMLVFEGLTDFCLEQILDSGQFFRYTLDSDGFYRLQAKDKLWVARQRGDILEFLGCEPKEASEIINFFDLERDYGAVKSAFLSLGDRVLEEAIKLGGGIRILKQDFFETLITFIISQNNNIPRIKGIVERLCESFGKRLANSAGEYFAFPEPGALAAASEADFAGVRAGFRTSYIIDAAKKYESGEVTEEKLLPLSYADAKKLLMTIRGVGTKVANCVLLFGDGRMCAFPEDVWIKRVILALYGDGFSAEKFGCDAGIAQQYLFYYARKNKLA